MNDFGELITWFFDWLVNNWWNKEITFFGLTTTIGIITGFCVIGSVILWFVKNLVEN